MTVQVVWGATEAELDGDAFVLEEAVGLQRSDVADLEVPASVTARVGVTSVGKGASGSGAALIFEVAEHVVNDTASLVAIGLALRTAINKVASRRRRPPADASAGALAALSAAQHPDIQRDPAAWLHTRTVPLTTDGGAGTDMRDVWASSFLQDSGGLLRVVFMSSTTRYLGTAVVATEWFFDGEAGRVRTDEELEALVRASFDA